MLIMTTRISKKTVLAVCGLTVILLLVFCFFPHHQATDSRVAETKPLTTNEERLNYLESMGWELEQEPVETLRFLLPDPLEEPYLSYSKLQDTQGYDFSGCCGKQLTRYTYTVKNYPDRPNGVQLNLYLCRGCPVGGDVCCPGKDGFQDILAFPEDAPS